MCFLNPLKKPALPCSITLIRIAPRILDFDNLVCSQKHVRDVVADWLIVGKAPGQADGDPRLEFHYEQKKGKVKEYALEIKFEFL